MQPTRFSIVLDIRPVDETTQEHARVLILSGLGERFGYIDEMLNQDLNDIVANYVEKAHIFLIGTIGNEIVCPGALVQEDQSTGRVVRMSVAKECRRRGFGTAMLQRLMDLAREKGYRKLLVETNNDWDDAIDFYKRFGFVEYDRDKISVYTKVRNHNLLKISSPL